MPVSRTAITTGLVDRTSLAFEFLNCKHIVYYVRIFESFKVPIARIYSVTMIFMILCTVFGRVKSFHMDSKSFQFFLSTSKAVDTVIRRFKGSTTFRKAQAQRCIFRFE